MLGSIIPSSRFLVDAVLAAVDWPRARVIVEYGPGVGTFTAEILRRMRSDARLIVIETNLGFREVPGRQLPGPAAVRGARLRRERAAHPRSAAAYHRANYIVSGIPLGSMPKPLQSAISIASREALGPRGRIPRLSIHEPRAAGIARDIPARPARSLKSETSRRRNSSSARTRPVDPTKSETASSAAFSTIWRSGSSMRGLPGTS